MGRSPCCEKEGLKKGPWTPEEDQKLLAFIEQHGYGSWRALPAKAGLQRCGKSCRLRWTNYLRPDIKRGKFSMQEDQTIIQLHALLGNRWSAIATHLPKRTDNEIKNYWNTHLKKRLTKMGIDPVTHKPKSDAFVSCAGATHSDLSHMAQWESARLEAEARLGRDSKLGSKFNNQLVSLYATAQPSVPPCLDVLRAWQATAWSKPPKDKAVSSIFALLGDDLESPTSILNFKENPVLTIPAAGYGGMSLAALGGSRSEWKSFENENTSNPLHEMAAYPAENSSTAWIVDTFRTGNSLNNHENVALSNMIMENFSDILTYNSDNQISSLVSGESSNFEENKNYWNTLLNIVNASAAGSPPVF